MSQLREDVDPLEKKSHTLDSYYSNDRKDDPEISVLDGIHDGLEFPSEEEKLTLRRVTDTIPWNAYRKSLPVGYHLLSPSPVDRTSHRVC